MKHAFVQYLPFCQHCGMTFQGYKEFSAVCPGQPMDDVIPPEGLPPPTPVIGDQPDLPAPAVRYSTVKLLQLIAKQYDYADFEMSAATLTLRRIATALATAAGVDPEAIVTVPGMIPKAPKGAMMIEPYLLNAQPYWTCWLPEARAALDAMEGTDDGE